MGKSSKLLARGLAAVAVSAMAIGPVWAAERAPVMTAASAASAPMSEDYVIGANDTIDIAVFQVPDLSRTVQVDSSGRVLLPLIGSVDAAGKTPNQLSEKISAELGAKYLKDPKVIVTVKDSNSLKVTVDGAVTQPGIFPLTGPTTLMQAVAMAKGPDPKLANTHKVAVIHVASNGSESSRTYDLEAIRSGKQPDPSIYPKDTVIVAGSGSKSFLQNFSGVAPFLYIFKGL